MHGTNVKKKRSDIYSGLYSIFWIRLLYFDDTSAHGDSIVSAVATFCKILFKGLKSTSVQNNKPKMKQ